MNARLLLSLLFLLAAFPQLSCVEMPPRVVVSGVQNYINPNIHEWDVRAGMFTFTSEVGLKPFAYSFTRGFHKRLLGAGIFKSIKAVDLTVGNDELALEKGREFGFDYVIFGHINEFRNAIQADTKPFISITFRIVDVRSGNTLWYIEDSISGDAPEYKKLLKMHSSDDYPPANYLADRLIVNIVDFLADFKARNSG